MNARWTIDNEGLQRRGRVVRCSREKDVSVCLWCSRSTSSFAKTHGQRELRITIDHCMWFTAWKYFRCEFCKFVLKLVMSPPSNEGTEELIIKLALFGWNFELCSWQSGKKHAQRKKSQICIDEYRIVHHLCWYNLLAKSHMTWSVALRLSGWNSWRTVCLCAAFCSAARQSLPLSLCLSFPRSIRFASSPLSDASYTANTHTTTATNSKGRDSGEWRWETNYIPQGRYRRTRGRR